MTEQERLERERNWVKTRFNCTVEGMFDELATLIQFDVRKFNKLSGRREVVVATLENGTITFTRKERTVAISAEKMTIKVVVMHRGSQVDDFEVRPEWNEDRVYCDLYIGDEMVSTHRASQKIIGDLLFA